MEAHSKPSVEEVVNRIKQVMYAKKYADETMVSKEDIISASSGTIESNLLQLDMEIRNNNLKWNIATEWIITSHRKTIGRFIIFGKRLVRKFLRWYINPLFDQQRDFNGSVTRSINMLSETAHLMEQEHHTLRSEVENIKKQLTELQTVKTELQFVNRNIDDSNEQLMELYRTIIYFFADRDPELSLAISVELFRITADIRFSNLVEQLNSIIVSKELN